MSSFSIDIASENIYNDKTKDYFNEVLQSYSIGSYRSAVVMLYSVVICDLVYKLEELDNIYGDTTSKKILIEIESIRKANPKSPEWESKIIDMVNERTKLLELSDYENILHLQKHRHLSAHPVMNKEFILFAPNKETVRAHIRNMLEGVLTKPPILSNKIFESFITDVSDIKDILVEDKRIKKYLEDKYLNRLSKESEVSIFKKIWKLVFKLSDEMCDKNREINFKVLQIIYSRREDEILATIEKEKISFSDIERQNREHMELLIRFISTRSKIFEVLDENAKAAIEHSVKNSFELFLLAWFVSSDFQDHCKMIEKKITNGNIANHKYFYQLLELAHDHEAVDDVLTLFVKYFGRSPNFDIADLRFNSYIDKFLPDFKRDHFILLLEVINRNDQIYLRKMAKHDNNRIKEYSDKVLEADFDYGKFTNFRY